MRQRETGKSEGSALESRSVLPSKMVPRLIARTYRVSIVATQGCKCILNGVAILSP
jgi:hypothetical protein